MTDTEKLRELLKEVRVFEAYEADYRFLMDEEVDLVLQACKEAGLIWWNRGNLQRILYQCGLNAEQVVKVILAINSQIKEIE